MRSHHEEATRRALVTALEAAVPLLIERYRRLPEAQFAALFDHGRLSDLADAVASEGDALLFGAKKAGSSARVFITVAEGIALLAFAPGGVRLFGEHWQAAR